MPIKVDTNTSQQPMNNNGRPYTPKEIVDYLNQFVIGQERAKKELAIAVYEHYDRILWNLSNKTDASIPQEYKNLTLQKSNVLMLGNTGTGKTFMVQNIAKLLGVPFHIHDCTKLTEAGYVGEDVENILTGLLQAADWDVDRAQIGICVLDEIDKCARASGENPSITRDVSGEGVQQSLLKIVEGSVVNVPPNGGRKHPEAKMVQIDTSNILFIAMGAFVNIENIIESRMKSSSSIGFTTSKEDHNEIDGNPLKYVTPTDLKKFGIIPELIGRFPVITYTNPLTKEDLKRIILEPQNSRLKQLEARFMFNGKKLTIKPDVFDVIVDVAEKNGTGARGLDGIIHTIMFETGILYEYPSSTKKNFVVTKEDAEKALNIQYKVPDTEKAA